MARSIFSSLFPLLILIFAHGVSAVFRGCFFHPPPLSEHMVIIADPRQQLVFLTGAQINLTWQTTYDTYNITMWQQVTNVGAQPANVNLFEKHSGDPEPGHFLWNISTFNFDRTASPVYYLDVKSNSVGAGGQHEEFLTFFFNLTDDATDPRLAISNAEVQKSAAMFPGAVPSDASAQGYTMATPSAKAADAGGLSPGAKVGLGVGLGLGIPLLAALGAILFLLLRKQKPTPSTSSRGSEKESLHDDRAKLAPAQYPPQQPPAWTATAPPAGAHPLQAHPTYMNPLPPLPGHRGHGGQGGFPLHAGAFTAYPVEAMEGEPRFEADGLEVKPGEVGPTTRM